MARVRDASDAERLEAVTKAIEDAPNAVRVGLKHGDQINGVVAVLQSYCQQRTAIVLHLGWQLGKGPRLDMRMGFHRTPGPFRLKSNLRRKVHGEGQYLRARYDMQLPVLVDVVKGVQIGEVPPDVRPFVAPSYVRLEMSERSPIALAQVRNATKVAVPTPGTRIDRELCDSFDFGREGAAESADVQFVGEVVQRRAEVEHDLARHERPPRLDAGQIAEIEAVLQSAPVYFGPNGPRFAWRPDRKDLLLKRYQLKLASSQLGEWPFEARFPARGRHEVGA